MSAIHSDISDRVDVKRLRDKRDASVCDRSDFFVRSVCASDVSGIDNAARIYYNFISDTPIPAYRIAALLNSEKESDVLS